MTKMKAAVLGLWCVLAVGIVPAQAQDFPNRPVHIVVPWPPGGNVDITARTLQPALSEALGQQVIVDNRAGAGGTIGSARSRSRADGYTLLLGSSGTITRARRRCSRTSPTTRLKDFVAVGAIQYVPMVLTAAPKTPVSNFEEYVAYAKSKGRAR